MATDTGEGNLSGLVVQSHEEFLRHHLGPELHRRYRELLSAEDRRWIDEARPLQWIPIRVSDRMFDAAAKATGRPKWELHDEVVGQSSAKTFRMLWRALLNLVTDEFLISRSELVVKKVYDRGRVNARMVGPRHAEIEVLDWPALPDRAFHGLRVAIASVLDTAGRKEPRVTAQRTSQGARYDARWS